MQTLFFNTWSLHKRHAFIVGACVGFVAVAIIGLFAYIAKDDLVDDYYYYKYRSIWTGDSLCSVNNKLGVGVNINIDRIPSKPSVNTSPKITSPIILVPVVNGNVIFMWKMNKYTIYISFGCDNKVVEKHIVDISDL
jgi:hypothetical protein